MTVAKRIESVRREIADAAREAGRQPDEITLVAVSKKTDAASVVDAIEAGQFVFGENYVNDGIAKISDVSALLEQRGVAAAQPVRWHLIGGLQSNKAARAARAFSMIESLDGARAARAISRAMEGMAESRSVLVQVRLGGAAGRAGVEPEKALELARAVAELPGLSLEGVMGVAPLDESASAAFGRLSGVLSELREAGLANAPLREMSAGMSGDFAEAIAAGSTVVRIGSAIFGQ
ncbi:MAG: YggS family pyridoxal phosphate-dependent enzyme [Planctomycetota bacterium]|jgi:pyridoxal phosphate enzyme (YggS family)